MPHARLESWLDKLDISEVVQSLARGIDRCDADLIAGAFWPDATDDHGLFKGSAKDFVAWVIPMLRSMERTQHFLGNILVEVDGDRAFSEAYFVAYHRVHAEGAANDMVAAGRYLDRFHKREGLWRIRHRQAVYDWTTTHPATDAGWLQPPMESLLERGRRAPADASYLERKAAFDSAKT